MVGAHPAPSLPPVSLLGSAVTFLAMLGSVTGAKWIREVSVRKARAAHNSNAVVCSDRGAGKGKGVGKKRVYPEYRIEDVKLHCSAKDAWVAIGDGVYDVTKWASHHPGGERNIVDISGRYGKLTVVQNIDDYRGTLLDSTVRLLLATAVQSGGDRCCVAMAFIVLLLHLCLAC